MREGPAPDLACALIESEAGRGESAAFSPDRERKKEEGKSNRSPRGVGTAL